MPLENQVTIKFTGDEKEFLKALQKVTKEINEQKGAASEAGEAVVEFADSFNKVFAAAEKVKGLADDIWEPFKAGAIDAAAQAERNFGVLTNQLEKRGKEIGITLEEIQTFSDELADATLTSQGAVSQAARTLLSFDQIAGDTLFRTITVAQDASEVLGVNLVGAVETFGEVLQNPKDEVAALSVVLENFLDPQIEYVKSLQEAGDLAAAQEFILGKLEERFSGAGLAAAQGYAGAIDTFGENVDDVARVVGAEFLPALTDLVNLQSSLLQGFLDLDPGLQSIIIRTTSYLATLASLTVASKALIGLTKTKIGLDLIELSKGAAKLALNQKLNFTQLKQIAIAKKQIISTGLLAGKLAAITVAIVALQQAWDNAGAEGVAFVESQKIIDKALLDLERQTGETTDRLKELREEQERAAKGQERLQRFFSGLSIPPSPLNPFNQAKQIQEAFNGLRGDIDATNEAFTGTKNNFFDFFGGGARKEVAKTRENLVGFVESVDELVGKDGLTSGVAQETIEALRREQEALDADLIGQKNVEEFSNLIQERIDKLSEFVEVNKAAVAGERDRRLAERNKQIEREIELTEDQIEKLQDRAEAEDISIAQKREDEAVQLQRDRLLEKEKREDKIQTKIETRQEAFDEARQKAEEDFNKEQQAIALQNEEDKIQLQRDREDTDRETREAFENDLEDRRERFETKFKKEEEAFEKAQRQAEEDFAEAQRDEQEDFNEAQRKEAKDFNDRLEDEKDKAAESRRKAEEALAEQISARLSAQAASFDEATRRADELGQLATAESEEERQKLVEEFEDRRRREAEVAALDLADKVFSADELIKQAKEIANITQVGSEEDAKKLQETIGLIQSQQQEQQAIADEQAKLELQQQLEAEQIAFEDDIEARKEAFRIKQQNDAKDFEQQLEDEKDAREERRQWLIDRRTAERQRQKDRFDERLEAEQAEFEKEQRLLRRQRQDDDREAARLFNEEQNQRREQFQEAVNTAQETFEEQQRQIQEDFAQSERDRQWKFEDEQRAEQRKFNEEERRKDEQTAERIAALQAQIQALETPVTPVDGALFKGGNVKAGGTYLVGERNPEPLVFNSGKVAMVGTRGPELIRPNAAGYVYPNIPAMGNAGLLSELQGLRGDVRNSPRSMGNATYNIVTQQDPVQATIKLQQEMIRQRSRLGRL